MPLAAGTSLGHYTITAPLGAGGMGEVYRAQDTKLDREVAIKVLPEGFAADEERVARFEREAKSLAALNHPNIATIFGFELEGDTHFLVMELVEGEDLAERMRRRTIPVDEAIPLFVQLAEGLEAAHEKGIIHRDLKPANLMITDDGRLKILDFGLAKALEVAPVEASLDQSQSPTMTAAATMRGEIMGTAAYMSPEQARGKQADRRSDIWALGAVLFEALSGKRPFEGRDASEVLGAVLRLEPAWDELPADTPPRLSTLVRRCLEKEPKQRVHDAADVRLAIMGGFEPIGPPPDSGGRAPVQFWQRPLVGLGIVTTTILVTGLAVWSAMRPNPSEPRPVARFVLQTPSEGPLQPYSEVAISRNGSHVVYAAGEGDPRNWQLFVREIGVAGSDPRCEVRSGRRGPSSRRMDSGSGS